MTLPRIYKHPNSTHLALTILRTLDDVNHYPAEDDSGTPLVYFRPRTDLKTEVKKIWDEPPSLSMRSDGEVDTTVDTDPYNPEDSLFSEEAERVTPFPPAYRSIFWKPTAVAVNRDHYIFYKETDSPFWGIFPLITNNESELLADLLSRIFVYNPSRHLDV